MAARTWLAVVLCCFVWFAYVQWFAPPIPPPTPKIAATDNPATPGNTATPGATPPAATPGSLFGQPFEPVDSHKLVNGKVEVALSAVGGKIAEVAVKDYRETIKKDAPPIRPLNRQESPLSLTTLFSDPALKEFGTGTYEGAASGSDSYKFSREDKTVRVTKEYQLDANSYFVKSNHQFNFTDSTRQNYGYVYIPIGTRSQEYNADDPLKHWEVLVYQNDELTRTHSDSLVEGETVLQGNTSWVGFGNRYFTTVVINDAALNPDVVLVRNNDFRGAYLRYPLQLKADQKELSLPIRVFSGPKDYAELSKVNGLRQVLDYGFFSFLAYPLLELLQFFYRFVHNYGVAIILLTLLVRAVFYPLSVKSARSMKAMQKLQPQIAALKAKYKDDMPRFNQEQMALFKAHKVNPLGGCLPMLVQLPVFFALYAVLGSSIELFHAPFFGWVQDLSSKDPYYIFPVLMGISMFVQQKMTPMAGMDPMQQKMMMFMPIVFSFIMINLPSGLTIYIFLSTLLGIVQQMLINREHKPANATLTVAGDQPSK